MINRRQFIQLASSVCALPSTAAMSAINSYNGQVIYGRDRNNAGSDLALEILSLALELTDLNYRLLNYPGKEMRSANEAGAYAIGDGSTILQTEATSLSLFPHIYSSLAYDPLTDFRPVAIIGEMAFALSVGPVVDTNVVTLDDYLDWVQEHPQFGSYGCTLYGSGGYLAGQILSRNKKIAIRAQPYSRSDAMFRDLAEGNLAAAFMLSGEALDAFNDYTLRPIAVTSLDRHPQWPTIKTFEEQGVKGMDFVDWYGWFLPAEADDATYNSIKNELNIVLESDIFAATLYRLGIRKAENLSENEIIKRLSNEKEKYRAITQALDISPINN